MKPRMNAVGERLLELVGKHHPARSGGEHAPLAGAERERVLREWNRTEAPYAAELCIHELFAHQARRTPDAPAVVAEGKTVTYAQLDRCANRLAHALRARGVGPEVRVGVLAERSAELVVALLGVLKAGGAYVPLDPAYPRERLQYMLADCGAGVLLARRSLDGLAGEVAGVPAAGAPAVAWLEEAGTEADEEDADAAPESGAGPDNLAYVIYTSGSTGRPKGVMIAHRGVCNLAAAERTALALGTGGRVLQFAPSSFDASVWEIFGALGSGAALHMASSGGPVAGDVLGRALLEGAITHVTLPPPVLATLPPGEYPALRTLVVAGEACPRELVDRWAPGRRFVNAYGPSEATVCGTLAVCAPGAPEPPPIGRPIQNVRAYVLDERLEPVPAGTAGELYLAGTGLARGYLHRPALTADRFVPDPFTGPGERLYRTGDRARWRGTGELDFLGRVDEQVKVRGFRIEPGEVEAALREHARVDECVVVALGEGGDRRLVAYVVGHGAPPEARALRGHLRRRVPEHMVPGEFVVLDRMPLSPSGKVDRGALPEPGGRPRPHAEYQAPRTELEARVADVWRQVLRAEQVGIHDDFIELGGNSLRALEVATRLQRGGTAEVPVRTLLNGCTVATLAQRLAEPAAGAEPGAPEVRRVPRDGPIPASVAQESIWLLTQLTPELPAYNARSAILLHGPLDVPALEHALTEIVRRHEIYRTTFHVVDGTPHQVIHDPWGVHLPVTDLRGLQPDERRARADEIRRGEFSRPFDLARLPLVRLRLLRLDDEAYELVFVEHHFVHDGWSFGIFMRELKALYEGLLAGAMPLLEPLHLQFADFASWQRAWLRTPQAAAQREHWRSRLAGTPPTLHLPQGRPRPRVFSYRGGQVWTALSPAQVSRVRALAVGERTTLYVTTLAVFQALLFRYSAQARFNVGVSAANRRRPEFDQVMGFLVNIFPVRADLSGDPTFRELLRRAHGEMADAQDNQEVPFGEIVRAVHPERVRGHNPLFQVSFNFHNAAMPEPRMGEVSITTLEAGDNGTAKFDLGVVGFPRADQRHGAGDEFTLVWEYSADLFDAATVQRMAEHYRVLLDAACADPDRPISELPLLAPEERRMVVEAWSRTDAAEIDPLPLHARFEAAAARTPDAPAVVFCGESLSYGELNRRANRLAHALRVRGVGPEVRVGVALERSAEMVAGILAILKAGGAYVPLDPAYPPERLRFMLRDSGAPLVLTRSGLAEGISGEGAEVLLLDAQLPAGRMNSLQQPHEVRLRGLPAPAVPPAPPTGEPVHDGAPLEDRSAGAGDGENLRSGAGLEHLAYVIYTSGSTGTPKGVAVPHCGVMNLLLDLERRQPLPEGAACGLWTSISFDVSVYEIFSALCFGRALHVPDEATRAVPADYVRWLAESRIQSAYVPPFMLRELEEQVERHPGSVPLRRLLVGVEPIPERLLGSIQGRVDGLRIINGYGPTEASVCATLYDVPKGERPERSTPIGRPVGGARAYVLDAGLGPVPAGVPGELYVGGAGLARGYLDQPGLTAERFVPDPLGGEPGERLYRTGDRVRWTETGELEFLGRVDEQVKVRGFRIEPGEVEAVLRAHPSVAACSVAARGDGAGGRRLVGYVVPRGDAPAAAELRAHLRARLPEPMVPGAFVVLERLPLTPSGKVDRAALPEPEGRPELQTAYEAPRTETEAVLCGIWREVLRVERAGIHDSFFELGGHSLLATRAVSRIREALHADVTLGDLFEHPTVASLARSLSRGDGGTGAEDAPAPSAAHLLSRVDELSEEELDRLLAGAGDGAE
jgi:amino acid adenylation domain-containing protein